MPDWSYFPLIRPALDVLGPRRARAVALRAMGTLASLPLGSRFVEAFGDLAAPPSLHRAYGPFDFVSPVGLGAGFDPDLAATRALRRFGVGYIEIGPITREPVAGAAIVRNRRDGTIAFAEPLENPGLAAVAARVERQGTAPARFAFRLAHRRGAVPALARDEVMASLERLGPSAAFVTLDMQAAFADGWSPRDCERHVAAVCAAARALPAPPPLLLAIPPDGETAVMVQLAETAVRCGAAGISVSGGMTRTGVPGIVTGAVTRSASLERVRTLRDALGTAPVVIGSGGIAAPADALGYFAAGATLVQIDSGFVVSGPALAKRINEGLTASEPAVGPAVAAFSWRSRWVWGAIYGAALVFLSSLVLLVAVTRVVLPYDEVYLGMTRAQIDGLDARLIPFMVHDRVTAGGSTMSIGLIYLGLAACGIRRGERWASRTVIASSIAGFASYWLWLRLGYFEPLHTLATVILMPFFIAVLTTVMPGPPRRIVDENDAAWHRSLIAQLLFVIVGVGFVIGGVTISVVGITSIFVHTDLVYLRTTAVALDAANRHLGPLIAHDRAGFGGALAADGLALALSALWGFRRGAAWLWWTLLVSGIPGFVSTLGVHAAVGYTDFWHLAPVNFALVLYIAGLVLAYPYLCANPAAATRRLPERLRRGDRRRRASES